MKEQHSNNGHSCETTIKATNMWSHVPSLHGYFAWYNSSVSFWPLFCLTCIETTQTSYTCRAQPWEILQLLSIDSTILKMVKMVMLWYHSDWSCFILYQLLVSLVLICLITNLHMLSNRCLPNVQCKTLSKSKWWCCKWCWNGMYKKMQLSPLQDDTVWVTSNQRGRKPYHSMIDNSSMTYKMIDVTSSIFIRALIFQPFKTKRLFCQQLHKNSSIRISEESFKAGKRDYRDYNTDWWSKFAAMPSLITAPSAFKFRTQTLHLLEFNLHQIINFAGLDEEDKIVFLTRQRLWCEFTLIGIWKSYKQAITARCPIYWNLYFSFVALVIYYFVHQTSIQAHRLSPLDNI